jgi:hypothetical protein
MTRFSPKWLQASQYAASEDRHVLGALWPNAASNGCKVTPSGAMDVEIAPGSVAVPITGAGGLASVLCVSDAVETVTLDPADAAGLDRVDAVICLARSVEFGNGATEDFIFDKVTGAAAAPGSTVSPAIPPNAVLLAEVMVRGGAAAVNDYDVYDHRPFGLAVGGPGEPPPSGGGIDSFVDSSGEAWVAKEGVNGGEWMRARDALHSRIGRGPLWTVNTTPEVFPYDTIGWDPYGLWDIYVARWTAPVDGLYKVEGTLYLASAVVNHSASFSLYIEDFQAVIGPAFMVPAAYTALGVIFSNWARLNKGDRCALYAQASPVAAGTNYPDSRLNYATFDYIGPA